MTCNYGECFFLIHHIGAPLWRKFCFARWALIFIFPLHKHHRKIFFFFFSFQKPLLSFCLSWFSVYLRDGGIKGHDPVLASNGPQPSPRLWRLVQGGGPVTQAEPIRTNEGQAKDFCWNFWERSSAAVAKL